jgi:hypothetical protein
LYKKQQAEAAKVARQNAAEEKREANKARAAELAAQRTLKKQERDAATAQKARDNTNTSKRKASHRAAKKNRQSVVVLQLEQVVLTLVLPLRPPHLKSARTAAQSRRPQNSSR